MSLHTEIIKLDSHIDTPLRIYNNPAYGLNNKYKQIDKQKLVDGDINIVFFAMFVHDTIPNKKHVALQMIERTKQIIDENQDILQLANETTDFYKIPLFKNKIGVFFGLENGAAIEHDLNNIQTFSKLGIKYITLCHKQSNDICDSCTDTSKNNGLSSFGKTVVKEMNRLGIMIDISHASDKTVRDVLYASSKPIIASHSCSKHMYNHPRNLSDKLIRSIANEGGVIQVCIFDKYLSESNSIVTDFVDHIEHIIRIAGIHSVGIGSDFDGGGGIEGCRNIGEIKNITDELINRNFTEKEIEAIWGNNFMRVFKANQIN